MSMQHRLPEQVVPADAWTLFCAECSQKMRITSAAPASPTWEGNMDLRMCLRSQRKDRRGPSFAKATWVPASKACSTSTIPVVSQTRLIEASKYVL
jgi:hypothetical protein